MAVTVPAPSTYPSGPTGYTAPAAQNLPSFSGTSESATVVSAYTDLVMPNETLVMTGVNLDSLADLVIWAGRDTVAVSVADKDLTSGRVAYAVMPKSPDWRGVVWCWPRDGDSAFGPAFRLNGPESLRKDTYEIFDGVTSRQIRIAGKNLTVPGYTPVVVVEHSGGTDTALTVTPIGDYELVCDIPDNLATGTYTVWVHNGTGGAYGWGSSDRMTLVVSAAPTALGADIDISGDAATEANLRQALTDALDAAYDNGTRILLAAGTYTLSQELNIPTDRPIQLVGQGEETWTPATSTFSSTGGTVLHFDMDAATGVVCLPLQGDRSGLSNLSARLENNSNAVNTYLVGIAAKHVSIDSCTLVVDYEDAGSAVFYLGGQAGIIGSATHKDYDTDITNCTAYANYWGVNHATWARYWRVNNNTFYMGYAGGGTAGNTIDDFGSRFSYYRDNTMRATDRAGGSLMNRGIMWHSNRCQWNTALRNRIIAGGWDDNCPGAIPNNQWEQIICHVGSTSEEVLTVDSGSTSTTLVVTTVPAQAASMTGENAEDFVAYIAKGDGVGQWRRVTALSSKTFTVDAAWSVTPSSGDKVIVHRAFRGMMAAHNTIDPSDAGTHADDGGYQLVGVLLYQGCYGCYVKGNRINHVSRGIGVWTTDPASVSTSAPSSWNDFRDNHLDSLYAWDEVDVTYGPFGGEPSPAMFVETHCNQQTQMDNLAHWIAVGNTFRNTRVATMEDTWVVQLGWQRKDNPADNSWTFTAGDKGMFLNVVEGSVLTGCDTLLTASPPANWSVLRNNRFDGSAGTNELLDSGDQTNNSFEAVVALEESAVNGTLSVGPATVGTLSCGPSVGGELSYNPSVAGVLEVN